MTYRVRSQTEILDGMLATVVANSELTDTNRGSIVRTVLEAGSLQDADQYLQIARLKNLFNIENATGDDLDERGADYDNPRLQPAQSSVLVKFADSLYTTKISTTLASSASPAATSLTLVDASSLPASGSVILERDTPGQRELVAYSSIAGNVLTLSTPTVFAHTSGVSVIASTSGSDRVFAANTTVSVPATDSTAEIEFLTQSAVTLLDGDVVTAEVTAISKLTGIATKVGSGQISAITSPPFQTATVTNDAIASGGRDEESDDDYKQRIKETIAALSAGTFSDILFAASQVSLASGQRVISAQEVEEFTDPDVSVYIDDGTGSVTTTANVTTNEVLLHRAEAGQRRAHLANWPVVSGTLRLKRSTVRGLIVLVTPGVGSALCSVPGAGFTPSALVGLVVIDDNLHSFTITANDANSFTVTTSSVNPVPGAFAVLPTSFLTLGTDYLFNETTGDIELVSGLVQYDSLVAVPNAGIAYTYYTGLIREVQKVLNGDPNDLDNYPGVKASGVKLKVRAPSRQEITFVITVITAFGTVEDDLQLLVVDAVQRYVNGLGIGDEVIVAEVIAAVMAIPGVTDCRVNTPSTNVIVLDGALPRTKSSLITVL